MIKPCNLKLHNVVFHFKLLKFEKEIAYRRITEDKVKLENIGIIVKNYHNFSVLKDKKLSFIFFFTSGHVNCTGTQSRANLKKTLRSIRKIFSIKLPKRSLTLVNSTWSGRFKYDCVDILSVVDGRIEIPKHWIPSVRKNSFPAAVIRQKEGPSAVIFKNGKFIIVGAKKSNQVKKLSKELRKIVPELKI